MKVYIYVSDQSETTLVCFASHGKHWEMPSGEVFDLMLETELYTLGGGVPNDVIRLEGRVDSAFAVKDQDLN